MLFVFHVIELAWKMFFDLFKHKMLEQVTYSGMLIYFNKWKIISEEQVLFFNETYFYYGDTHIHEYLEYTCHCWYHNRVDLILNY